MEFLYPNDEEGSAGGAIYLGEHTAATITGSVISGNSAYRNGGGIYFEGTLDIRSSSISGNESAKGNGGGLYCDDPDGPLTITQSTFGQNTAALIGGGVYCMDFDAQLSNSYFIENQAHQAGGLYLINGAGTVDINDCVISENIATGGAAGGMWSLNTPGTVRNCIFSGNKVTSMAGSGGALSIYSESPEVFNCLFTGNSAPNKGGGVMCAIYAYPFIANCTFADNHVDDYGGGVYCDATSGVEIINSIFANCNNKAIYEQNGAISGVTVTYSHFWNEPTRFYGKDFYLYNVSYESNNVFDSSQRFAGAFLRDYYLMAGGPAIDYGYRTASYWGLDTRTTQVSGALDSSTVDLGYHYTAKPPQYPLEVELIGPGIIEVSPQAPDANGYYAGTIVRITVLPAGGWRVKSWKGTSDESSTERTALVVISSITRKVVVELEPMTTWHVPTDYPTLQRAIDAAGEGDTIVIAPGEYQPPGWPHGDWSLHLGGITIWGKNIVITSSTPDSPDLTILRGMDFNIRDVGPETIITGFTLRDTHWRGGDGWEPKTSGHPGFNGVSIRGGVMGIYNASPTIVNLIIDNVSIEAGDGSDGVNGDEAHPNGGNGGWGGSAYGGAIYLDNSSPTFKGVCIRNCAATAGDGGNGGDAEDETSGWGGRGGNWEFKDKDAAWWASIGLGWHFPRDRYGDPIPGSYYHYDPETDEIVSDSFGDYTTAEYADYWLITAMGGGVYIDSSSNPVFEDCTFSNNRVEGGYCGIGGLFDPLEYHWPEYNERIESFGGAVYVEVGASPTFEDCNFSGNLANNEHIAENHSPYISYGGALANGTLTPKARSGKVTLKGCTFSDNDAAIGGAMFCADATAYLFDCNFIDNTAFEGAGMFASVTEPTILTTVFKDNKAGYTYDPCDTSLYHEVSVHEENIEIGPPRFDILGLGGGIYCSSSPAAIGDSRFLENISSGSGGGAYLLGDTPDDINGVSINNCLFAGNVAVIEGGGIGTSFNATANLLNCTLADNIVTGIDREGGLPDMAGYGAGLACTYNGSASIKNTIIWGNHATQAEGREISVGAYDPNGLYNLEDASMLTVSYSDIEGGEQYAFIRPPMHGWPGGTLVWVPKDPNNPDDSTNLHGMTRDDPFFITGDLGDYYLGHVDANDPNHLQEETSRCVDGGDGEADLLPFGKFRYTTRTDNESDVGPIDIGYHFYKSGKFGDGDINYDVEVDLEDIAFLASHWLESCVFPGWCGGSDISWDGIVNFMDYALLFETYEKGDTEAPVPNPITWDMVPAAKNETSITMTAAEAFDNSGLDVQYYFACVYSDDPCTPGKDSGWTFARTYTNLNLVMDMEYGYKVKARDDTNNQTAWSFVGYAITGEDTRPPTPNPMTWAFEPAAAGFTSIVMTATTAVDDFGGPVEYYFERYSGPGIANSGWQSSPTWTDVILSDPNQLNDPNINITVDTQFGYHVKARDVQADPNNYHETAWSEVAYATLGPDAAPPVPNPMTWENPPSGNGAGSLTMTATEAEDRAGTVVEYYFWCVTDTYYNSDWQTDRTYTVTGLNPAVEYCFVIIARDENDNRTEWSLPACARPGDDEAPPLPNPMTWDIPPAGYSDTSVIMTATEAFDDGSDYVEYEFKCVFGQGHDRGPDPNRMYCDTGLTPETQYGYVVRAIDGSGNATNWSLVGYATSEDASPPTPDPMTWAVGGQPRAMGTDSVTMTAATAYDISGVEYYFENIDGNGHDRIWQDNPTYTDTGLPPADPENPDDPNAAFAYRVRARDKSLNQNETQPSEVAYAYTYAPPIPNPSEWDPAVDANGFSGYPHQTYNDGGSFGYGFSMRALPATHANGVEYYFQCTNISGFSSSWQSSPLYFKEAVGNQYLQLWFRVKTREAGNPANETVYSPPWPTR
ncbi:MAG: right-handed parallel beta-helix repeat-containing protein [Planctomycetota bacterium]